MNKRGMEFWHTVIHWFQEKMSTEKPTLENFADSVVRTAWLPFQEEVDGEPDDDFSEISINQIILKERLKAPLGQVQRAESDGDTENQE